MAEREAGITRALYSWFDVDFLFRQKQVAGEWPDWLVTASAYHDGLVLRVRAGTAPEVVAQHLESWFGQRYRREQGILLEGVPSAPRPFAVQIEPTNGYGAVSDVGIQPSFRRVALFPNGGSRVAWPPPFPNGCPPVAAFYSFKGGVGRTTHLLAYALALASRRSPFRTLIVDADLEAPGITSLLHAEETFGPAEFSFVDLLAMAHSDADGSLKTTMDVASYALRKQTITIDTGKSVSEHFVLPAFRTSAHSLSLDIRPEHLISTPDSYWSIGELIARLGCNLEVDAVLVDLRAGLSELASPLLFDPRIKRFIVTTPSKQSVDGTLIVLQQLGKLAPLPSRSDLSDPSLIVSFVLPELSESAALRELDTSLLSEYPEADTEVGQDTEVDLSALRIEHTGFAQELLYIRSISDGLEKLVGTSVARVMGELAKDVATQFELPTQVAPSFDLESVRADLSKIATDLEYAESGKGDRFLAIAPIRNLAKQFAKEPPIAVVIGPKGAGKTYTCLQIIRSDFWSRFVTTAGGEQSSPDWGLLWPLFQSKNLKDSAKVAVDKCKTQTLRELNSSHVFSSVEVEDSIREALHHTGADETWWRHRWFTIIARSLGVRTSTENASASELINDLNQKQKKLVVVLDGLEDLFPALERKPEEQTALRSLLQGVPNYLREVPDSPLGVVVFIRADLAQDAIPQNYGQFARLYEGYALRWNEQEALRLAVWLTNEASLPLEKMFKKKAETMSAEEAKEALFQVWGKKLGPANSREARSAEWVIAALSDFRGQIQARDLVRFFGSAAADKRNASVTDRVLAPRAIRDALLPCSSAKIEEIKQEIQPLKGIFARLQQATSRRIPFDAATSGLNVEEIHFLETVGILIEDRGEYFMPEIFRLGLGFQTAQGARPRVLSLARRVTR